MNNDKYFDIEKRTEIRNTAKKLPVKSHWKRCWKNGMEPISLLLRWMLCSKNS